MAASAFRVGRAMVKEQVLKLSAVITTRNEEANIANCISSFAGFRDEVEVVVVDKHTQ